MDEAVAIADFYRGYAGSFTTDMALYEAVCDQIGDHPGLISLLASHPASARQPNLLFAAVHDLVLSGVEHPLADLYAELGRGAPVPSGPDAVAVFVDFVLAHRARIDDRISSRTTQTNEVGRAAFLALFARHARARLAEPMAWIDLGASAGLNSNLERFRIDYSSSAGVRSIGPSDSAVRLRCEVRHGEPPIGDLGNRGEPGVHIPWRIGVDRAPIDVTDPTRARWLRACLWPNQPDRLERLDAAITLARESPPQILAADASDGIPEALALAPPELPILMTTTWVWYYLPDATRRSVLDALRRAGRPVLWYSLEGVGVVDPAAGRSEDVRDSCLTLVSFQDGNERIESLGTGHPHGQWLRWAGED